MPRTALLISLANRMCFDTRPILLQHALLEEGIQLQEYQQPLPNDPIEHGRHKALLGQAYKLIKRQQANLKEQEDTEPIDCSLEPSLTSNDSDPDSVESDTELEVLAARLEATAPFAAVDPTFRKSLRDKLLNILAEQPHHESVEAVLPSIPKTTRKRGDTEETNIDQEPILTSNNSASDPELAALVAYLDQTSSFAMTDPAFRKMIQDELARIHARYSSSDQGVERALEKTEASLLVATSY